MRTKNLHFTFVSEDADLEQYHHPQLYSQAIEDLLAQTYPEVSHLFPFKKSELYQLIFRYFFEEEEILFHEIKNFTNLNTACNLRRLQLLIQRNHFKSFAALDRYMALKQTRKFSFLSHSLATHEILNVDAQVNIVAGKLSKRRTRERWRVTSLMEKILTPRYKL